MKLIIIIWFQFCSFILIDLKQCCCIQLTLVRLAASVKVLRYNRNIADHFCSKVVFFLLTNQVEYQFSHDFLIYGCLTDL